MKIRILNKRLKKKALQSSSNYKIAAAAYTKHGNLLGMTTNHKNMLLSASRKGAGIHAERELMRRYGNKISYIILARVGRTGSNNLPIHPCATCAKLAEQLGIRIIPIHELLDCYNNQESL